MNSTWNVLRPRSCGPVLPFHLVLRSHPNPAWVSSSLAAARLAPGLRLATAGRGSAYSTAAAGGAAAAPAVASHGRPVPPVAVPRGEQTRRNRENRSLHFVFIEGEAATGKVHLVTLTASV